MSEVLDGAIVDAATVEATTTRLIAMGSGALMQGFALVGCEVWPDAVEQDLELVLAELIRNKSRAILLLESNLAQSESQLLKQLRDEGGHIIITEIPPLQAPSAYRSEVEDLVLSVLGKTALEDILLEEHS